MKNICLILFIFFNNLLFAQSNDSVALFKKYISVCNAYKQLPLQLEVDYKKSSNMILHNDDSATMKGVFYIQKDGAYIHFGDAEQIITDSLVLIVMNSIKQMVLSESTIDITDQMNKMISMPIKDSSINNLTERYIIQQKILDKETGVLEIRNRQNVYGTQLPFEVNTLTYNLKNGDPIKIETMKRGLVKKPAENNAKISATVISIPQKGDYFLKEDNTVYLYKSLTHDANKKLPVLLKDRIEKNTSANYMPVTAYKNYVLIMN